MPIYNICAASPVLFIPKLRAKFTTVWASLGLFVLYTGYLLYKHLTTPDQSEKITSLPSEVLLHCLWPKLNLGEAAAMRLTCHKMKVSIDEYFLPDTIKLVPICRQLLGKAEQDSISVWDMVGAILSLGIPGFQHIKISKWNLEIIRKHLLKVNENPGNWVLANLPAICRKMQIKRIPEESLETFLERALKQIGLQPDQISKITYLDMNGLCTDSDDLHRFLNSSFFKKLGTITHLNLRQCPLATLPESIRQLSGLTYLNLRWCIQLTELPEWIGELSALTHLDLGWCSNLTALPESIENLNKLVYLNLSGWSSLDALPLFFEKLTQLVYLNLSGCRNLTTLPTFFEKFTALRYLDLFECTAITEVPDYLKRCIVPSLDI